jgi:hypothetical protein
VAYEITLLSVCLCIRPCLSISLCIPPNFYCEAFCVTVCRPHPSLLVINTGHLASYVSVPPIFFRLICDPRFIKGRAISSSQNFLLLVVDGVMFHKGETKCVFGSRKLHMPLLICTNTILHISQLICTNTILHISQLILHKHDSPHISANFAQT